MALSAWVKPSSDPMAILVIVLPSSVAKSSTRPDLKKRQNYEQLLLWEFFESHF